MADKKISELPVVTTVEDTDLLTTVRPGDAAGTKNKQISGSNAKFAFRMDKTVLTGAADYNPSILTDDDAIVVDDTAAVRNVIISTEDVQSASPTSRRTFYISDESPQGAAVNNITISLENGGTINGNPNFVIAANRNSIILKVDGTNGQIY
jgi:hypothetical protein